MVAAQRLMKTQNDERKHLCEMKLVVEEATRLALDQALIEDMTAVIESGERFLERRAPTD